jgi:integrase
VDKSISFSTEADALAIPPPVQKTHVEHWHAIDSYFGMRIMRPRKDKKITRRWLVRFYEGGKDYRITLGAVGRVSWDKARHEALTRRLDVQARRERGVVPPTFAEAYRRYASVRGPGWAADTVQNYEKAFKLLEPWFGKKRVDQVTSLDIGRAYEGIKRAVTDPECSARIGKDGKPRRRPANNKGDATAIAALRLAKTIFNADSSLQQNPCIDLLQQGVFRRGTPRSTQVTRDQLPAFCHWLHHRAAIPVRDYVLCALFMALRSSVAGSLKWSNLVEDQGRYAYKLLPDQRGNKTRELVAIPVPTYVAEMVINPRKKSPYKHKTWIIESPKRAGHPLRSIRGSLAALKKDTGTAISLHDLRRTITSAVVRTSDLTNAKRVLTHSLTASEDRAATSARYFVSEYDDMRRAMNRAVMYIRKKAGDLDKLTRSSSEVPEPDLDFESELVDAEAQRELLEELAQIDEED